MLGANEEGFGFQVPGGSVTRHGSGNGFRVIGYGVGLLSVFISVHLWLRRSFASIRVFRGRNDQVLGVGGPRVVPGSGFRAGFLIRVHRRSSAVRSARACSVGRITTP